MRIGKASAPSYLAHLVMAGAAQLQRAQIKNTNAHMLLDHVPEARQQTTRTTWPHLPCCGKRRLCHELEEQVRKLIVGETVDAGAQR